eukprot:SAG31_NODE_326_length_17664_cov_10.038543_4_plen_143_part_00
MCTEIFVPVLPLLEERTPGVVQQLESPSEPAAEASREEVGAKPTVAVQVTLRPTADEVPHSTRMHHDQAELAQSLSSAYDLRCPLSSAGPISTTSSPSTNVPWPNKSRKVFSFCPPSRAAHRASCRAQKRRWWWQCMLCAEL